MTTITVEGVFAGGVEVELQRLDWQAVGAHPLDLAGSKGHINGTRGIGQTHERCTAREDPQCCDSIKHKQQHG
jgi:hypothetical protein